MKWFLNPPRQATRTAITALVLLCALSAMAAIPEWVRYVESGSPLRDVFFRTVSLPSGEIRAERPPSETRAALSSLVDQHPEQAALYALRAREAERQLDFVAAEQDWKQYAALAPTLGATPAEAQLALADYYHRRLRPQDEIAALLEVAQSPPPASEKFTPAPNQRSWKAFERVFAVAKTHRLPREGLPAYYEAWRDRYPAQASLQQKFVNFLINERRYDQAREAIGEYRRRWPDDQAFPVRGAASLAETQGSAGDAIQLYGDAFDPLWPPSLIEDYFGLLERAGRLRAELDLIRARLRADPGDLKAAAWTFHYYARQRNIAAAQAALNDFRLHKESGPAAWTALELHTLARLFHNTANYNEAARYYYAGYSLPLTGDTAADDAAPGDAAAGEANAEQALAGLIHLLLATPEQSIAFGSGDLSLYQDIAVMDDHPGFLNGVLSLLFNAQQPQYKFSAQQQASAAYFHRARAATLLTLFARRFPDSQRGPSLHAQVIEAYATHGDNQGVVDKGQAFLAAFPEALQRTRVSFLIAEAHARNGQVEEEFATYDALLAELAAKTAGVPLGEGARRPSSRSRRYNRYGGQRAAQGVRSPEYARVLDRYIARLVSLERTTGAMELYASEIARNPADPALYERLAAFLEQNGLSARMEAVYRRAIAQFQDRSWHHKLARWYLRTSKRAEFAALTREITGLFSGTELDAYFQQVVGRSSLSPALYLQVNLYALERFPHNLTFVKNLLRAYRTRQTRNNPAWVKLIREYWFHDDDLRARFFAYLTRTGQLASELQALSPAQASTTQVSSSAQRWQQLVETNPAAAQFVAEAELWRCHFEDAAPVLQSLSSSMAVDSASTGRSASVHRSLAYNNPGYSQIAASIAENQSRYRPADRQRLARVGDFWADQQHFDRAAPFWNRMAEVEPGNPQGYLDAATVFWDYYHFDDALRLIKQGRQILGEPSLYAYEAGAVYENKRDYDSAIREYLKGALAESNSSPARRRLIQLSRRPAHRDAVEQITAGLVLGRNPRRSFFALRVAVLEAQRRRADLASFLARLSGDTTSFELLEEIIRIARNNGMGAVHAQALQQQAAIATDPVSKMRLQLARMHLFESSDDIPAARRVLNDLYQRNPKTLGIVRAAADFHVRRGDFARALNTIEQATADSYPALKKSFLYEAARTAITAKLPARARGYLATLRQEKPFDTRYLAAMADTYASEGDYAALRAFYEETISSLRSSDLPRTLKTSQIASLRRGLIPALTNLGDHTAAIDQYIEIINRFPEDASLVEEAARYARRHDRREQLTSFYVKTTAGSPRDVRHHQTLAWLHTHFEDFPAAIEAYAKAHGVRPDRVSIVEGRAALEERLLRFGGALASYRTLYELTYENPRWMEKIAETLARLGRRGEAVRAIEKALIEGRPERPGHYFAAARRLEGWSYLAEAEAFARKGIESAGQNLYATAANTAGASQYAALMARQRKYSQAYHTLKSAYPAKPNDFTLRRFRSAVRAMAPVVARDYTPKEKTTFVAFLERRKAESAPNQIQQDDIEQTLLPIARQAGLAELEVKWLHELMMATPGRGKSGQQMTRLVDLQNQRLRFRELGRQLENYARVYPRGSARRSVLRRAAEAYRAADDEDSELRVWRAAVTPSGSSQRLWQRYFELLLKRDPDQLLAFAHSDPAANFIIEHGDSELALRAIQTRGRKLPPVWTDAYTGLVGLHFDDRRPRINQGFLTALGDQTIGQRIGQSVDRKKQLAGDLWFYYGSRYGEYLRAANHPLAQRYLSAMLEGAAGRSSAYLDLADFYREQGDAESALIDYEHALELDASNARALIRAAETLWSQDRRDEAIARWRAALKSLGQQIQRGSLTPTFRAGMMTLLEIIHARGLRGEFRQPVTEFFTQYARRADTSQLGSALRAWVASAPDPSPELTALIEAASKASDAIAFLAPLAGASWVPASFQEQILGRITAVAQARLPKAIGQSRYSAQQTYEQWSVRHLDHLVTTGQAAKAQRILDDIPEKLRQTLRSSHPALLIRIAAHNQRLDTILSRYDSTANPEPGSAAPPLTALRDAAVALRQDGDTASARRLLDFYYTRLLNGRDLSPANFLGLAELRLEQGQHADAVALLRRMTLITGAAFEQSGALLGHTGALLRHNRAAAGVLTKAGRHTDAASFLAGRIQAAPWDAEARLELAQSRLDAATGQQTTADSLAALASSSAISYSTRVTAAKTLAASADAATSLPEGELRLLASGGEVTTSAVSAPFFVESKLVLADRTTSPGQQAALLRAALETRPEDSSIRLALFRSARASGDHNLALQAIRPLLLQSGLVYRLSGNNTTSARDPREQRADRWLATRFLANLGLDNTQRTSLARDAADSMQRSGRLVPATQLYQVARQLESAPAKRDEIETKIETLYQQQEARQASMKRRPRIHKNLDQDRLVRPRQAAAALSGGAQ